MAQESIAPDRILIVPGYTDAEILQMSSEEGQNKEINPPAALYIEAKNIGGIIIDGIITIK